MKKSISTFLAMLAIVVTTFVTTVMTVTRPPQSRPANPVVYSWHIAGESNGTTIIHDKTSDKIAVTTKITAQELFGKVSSQSLKFLQTEASLIMKKGSIGLNGSQVQLKSLPHEQGFLNQKDGVYYVLIFAEIDK